MMLYCKDCGVYFYGEECGPVCPSCKKNLFSDEQTDD